MLYKHRLSQARCARSDPHVPSSASMSILPLIMGSSLSILGIVLLLGTVYVLRKVLANYLEQSPLDNIPGPPAASWLNGKHLHPTTLLWWAEMTDGNRALQAALRPVRVGFLCRSQPQLRPCNQDPWDVGGMRCLSLSCRIPSDWTNARSRDSTFMIL